MSRSKHCQWILGFLCIFHLCPTPHPKNDTCFLIFLIPKQTLRHPGDFTLVLFYRLHKASPKPQKIIKNLLIRVYITLWLWLKSLYINFFTFSIMAKFQSVRDFYIIYKLFTWTDYTCSCSLKKGERPAGYRLQNKCSNFRNQTLRVQVWVSFNPFLLEFFSAAESWFPRFCKHNASQWHVLETLQKENVFLSRAGFLPFLFMSRTLSYSVCDWPHLAPHLDLVFLGLPAQCSID